MDQNTLSESRPDIRDGSRQAGRQQCLTQLSIFSRRRARAATLNFQGCLNGSVCCATRLMLTEGGWLSWPLGATLSV